MEAIGGIIGSLWKTKGWQERLAGRRIWKVWEEAVGPEVARRAQPADFGRGRLTVRVTNSVWMQQLRLQARYLKRSLNRALGEELVKEITFRLGPVRSKTSESRPPVVVPTEVKEALARELAHIEDEDLREAFLRLRIKAWQAKEAQRRKRPSAWEV